MRYFYACLILLLAQPVLGSSPEERGDEIVREADQRSSGFHDYSVDMEMVLRNRQKEESHRTIRSLVLEIEGDGDKSLTIFDSPGDVRGTALLTFSHPTREDDQWLYLPAITRVKRINSSSRAGSFMGSEFAFEDLGSREIEKYTSRFLGEEELHGQRCYVVELFPKKKKSSGYSRIVSWLDKKEYRALREEYYDKKKRLKKTLTLTGYRLYLNSIWRPHHLTMVNHLNGRETDLIMTNYRFHQGLLEHDFSVNSLKRYR